MLISEALFLIERPQESSILDGTQEIWNSRHLQFLEVKGKTVFYRYGELDQASAKNVKRGQ